MKTEFVLNGKNIGEKTTVTIRNGKGDDEPMWVADVTHTWDENGVSCVARKSVGHNNRSHANIMALNAAMMLMMESLDIYSRPAIMKMIASQFEPA